MTKIYTIMVLVWTIRPKHFMHCRRGHILLSHSPPRFRSYPAFPFPLYRFSGVGRCLIMGEANFWGVTYYTCIHTRANAYVCEAQWIFLRLKFVHELEIGCRNGWNVYFSQAVTPLLAPTLGWGGGSPV